MRIADKIHDIFRKRYIKKESENKHRENKQRSMHIERFNEKRLLEINKKKRKS